MEEQRIEEQPLQERSTKKVIELHSVVIIASVAVVVTAIVVGSSIYWWQLFQQQEGLPNDDLTVVDDQSQEDNMADQSIEEVRQAQNCFFGSTEFSKINTSDWETASLKYTDDVSEGPFVEFEHPETINIVRIVLEEDTYPLSGVTEFLITSSLHELEARLIPYDLDKRKFSIGSGPRIWYEPFSNKWFEFTVLGRSLQDAVKECFPNPIEATNTGMPIYQYAKSDAGYGSLYYFIMGRDSYAINFRGDPFVTPMLLLLEIPLDPQSDSDSVKKFKSEIENLIKTIRFPVSYR